MLLSIARTAIAEAGACIKGDINVPPDVPAISRELLKGYARTKGYLEDGKPDNANRAMLSRDLKRLSQRKYIGMTETHVWIQKGVTP